MTDSKLSINLLFPVLNERLRLEKGITTCMEYLRENIDNPYKLTILDNGSDDETPEIAHMLEEKYPEVTYVRIEERGVGIAFKTGIEANTSNIVGYMDIDLSTDLRFLKQTIHMFEQIPAVQYINGSRFHRDSDTRGRKWYRKITSKGLLIMLKVLFGMKCSDALCGFTFLRAEAASELVAECSDDHGWFYTVEFLLRAEKKGMNIVELPVEWIEDYDTTVKVWKTIKNYIKQMYRLKKIFRAEGI